MLSVPSPLTSSAGKVWKPLDLWQAHADGDQLEIYAAATPGETASFSNNDAGGEDDPVPYLDRAGGAANGVMNGKEQLAPSHRLLWLDDVANPERCKSVLFEATDYCQVVSRTWSPQFTPEGFPLILNLPVRDPSAAMISTIREALAMPMPRDWGPKPAQRDVLAPPLPGSERWLPQLRPQAKRSRNSRP